MSQTSASSIIEFLSIVEGLKRTKRTGWINNGIRGGESIADHMYRMSIMAMLIDDPTINRTHCIKMSIVHDIAESLVGDITPYDGISKEEKYKLEKEGMKKIMDTLENSTVAQEIEMLWLEYEENKTNEAKLVHDLDKCEMIQQAMEYELSEGKQLDSFFESTKGIFSHPQVKEWVEEIYRRRKRSN
ncbi:hypothetical protein COEREDRAFT_38672 [Coemansia reversa NRRL 1564]|uniref:HD domain-containing protein n=1 Tax=Coemansia reversa (strain ATCC 12441 / NRRL 1564) TaxID=763665 RepID=A0A2G5BHP1_COERN|nr:hypothetical protein COEREDRAFT_38672 [Coemansia reversa NRRL 1564]|eukprot:PIA18523.1 hypothetical protein COEREDRAFT_38672 [Coemansia reversa NRRL 1564]